MAHEVDIHTFAAAHADGAVVIDVREPYEYLSGHVPGARLMPLQTVPVHGRELPAGRPVYVICATGNRSLAAAEWLGQLGYDARSVAGGTSGWTSYGYPLVLGGRENAA